MRFYFGVLCHLSAATPATVASPYTCVLKAAVIRSYAHALTVAFLQLQYLDGSPFLILMMHSLHGEKKLHQFHLQVLGVGLLYFAQLYAIYYEPPFNDEYRPKVTKFSF